MVMYFLINTPIYFVKTEVYWRIFLLFGMTKDTHDLATLIAKILDPNVACNCVVRGSGITLRLVDMCLAAAFDCGLVGNRSRITGCPVKTDWRPRATQLGECVGTARFDACAEVVRIDCLAIC